MKNSMKNFIGIIEPNRIENLINNQDWDEKIFQILQILFMIYDYENCIETDDLAELRDHLIDQLSPFQNDPGNDTPIPHLNVFSK